MATQIQLKVLFGRKHLAARTFRGKNSNKVVSFSALFFMFTLIWTTYRERARASY